MFKDLQSLYFDIGRIRLKSWLVSVVAFVRVGWATYLLRLLVVCGVVR